MAGYLVGIVLSLRRPFRVCGAFLITAPRTAFLVLLMVAFSVCSGSVAMAETEQVMLKKSELAVGRTVGNYKLVDQDWKVVPFNTFRGRSVLISFMYADCHGPCFLINESLEALQSALSEDIADSILTLSVTIDTENDTPGKLKEYGADYTENFDRWKFVSTDEATLKKMVADLGFTMEKKEDLIDHMNRLTLISPSGVVMKHFYGTDYEPKEIEEAVRTVMAGRPLTAGISDAFSRFLLYCSTYDAETNTYRIDYFLLATAFVQYMLVMGTLLYLFRNEISNLFYNKIISRFRRRDKA